MSRRILARLTTPIALAMLCACGGGGGGGNPPQPSAATRLAYADPTDAGRWRLARNAASTSTHLVLDLLAPTGSSGRGVSLVLDVDGTRGSWEKVDAADAARAKARAYTGDLLLLAKAEGNRLRALVTQKGSGNARTYGASPVVSIALDLVPGASPGTVAVTQGSAWHLDATQIDPAPITIQVGALTAQ